MTVMEARNPRTGAVDYRFDATSPEQVAAVAAAARRAQQPWFSKGLAHRISVLQAWAGSLERHEASIAAALAVDTGRTRISHEEVGAVVHFIHGFCDAAPDVLAEPFRKFTGNPDVVFKTNFIPYPVVGVVSPWNFPLVLAFIDAIAALVAGAAVVIKPSEVTPRFVEPLQKSIDEVPGLEGVISLVRGGAETGKAVIANSDAVVFTGSVATGRKIAVAAAEAFIPAFLELGGKDPAVVLAGSDVERAATSILRSAMYNTGQVCYNIERVYVHESIYDAFVEKLRTKIGSLKRSRQAGDGGHYGPFIHGPQADRVAASLRDAVEKGARILTGGVIDRSEGGVWLDPTLVVDVDHRMKLMTEETFGPVLPVMKFATEDEAAMLANDTIYGLSGAVFGPDTHTAGDFALRVYAGGVSINDTELPRGMMFDGEKTAFRCSGMGGSRYGATSILRYVRKRALMANEGGIKLLDALEEA